MSKTHFPDTIRKLPEFDGAFDAHRLPAEGCEVLFATYPAGTTLATHTHETHNLGIITEGQLILTMDGKSATYGPGDWYEVPANREHAASFDVETSEIEFWFSADAL